MNTFVNSSAEEGGGGGIGIAPASHVYGPANVHVLPCKIHYTGPAPVATYFRPRQPIVSRDADPQDENIPPPNETERELTEKKSVEDAKEPEKRTSAAEEEGVMAVLSNRREGQVWEQKDDDPEESIAQFRGRKLIGRKIVFPQGVHGVLLKEKPWPQDLQEDHEDLSSFWAAETSFREVTVSEE